MRTFFTALKLFACLTVLTGLLYPLAVTSYALVVHPEKAKGSLITLMGKPAGSSLIAQKFTGAQYFHPRPSAVDYNPLPSGGSNASPAGKALRAAAELRAGAEWVNTPDMIYASASGLDPHISPAAANAQCERVALARGAAKVDIMSLIDAATEPRQFGILGEPRVNVLPLNLELDRKYPYERK